MSRTDALHAAGAGLGALLLYGLTVCPTIAPGDSPELVTAARVFGVCHPPGYPLYTMLTGLWMRLFPAGMAAVAGNLASALYAACALAAALLLFRRIGMGLAAAWFGAITLAVGRTLWAQSVAAEVYTFDLMLLLLTLHAAWSAARNSSRRDWLLAGIVLGAWIGHRFINAAFVPALAAFYLAGRRADPNGGVGARWVRQADPIALAGFLAALALPYLYLPLASRTDPALDIGNPDSLGRLWTVVSGTPYLRHLAGGTASLSLSRLGRFAIGLPVEAGAGIAAAAVGIWFWLRAPRASAGKRTGGPGAKTTLPASFPIRANWLGASFALLLVADLAVTVRYNVPDVGSFWLPAFLALAGFAAWGLDRVDRRIPARVTPGFRTLVRTAAIVVALVPAGWNWGEAGLRGTTLVERHGRDMLDSVSPRAVLIASGDTSVHALWYMQAVEKRAPDVIVISVEHASPWYFDQLRRRYRDDSWPEERAGEPGQVYIQRAIESLSATRPVYFAFGTGDFARAAQGDWWPARAVLPAGKLLEVVPKDSPDDGTARAARNEQYWARVMRDLGPVRLRDDFETAAIQVGYAVAALRAAEFSDSQGRPEGAVALYKDVLAFHPTQAGETVARTWAAIGKTLPLPDLEARATERIRELEAAPAR